MFNLKAVISIFTLAVLLSGTAHASNNVTEAYSYCKTAVKEKSTMSPKPTATVRQRLKKSMAMKLGSP